MNRRIRRRLCAGLLAAILPGWGASAAPPPPGGDSGNAAVADFLDHGMPLSARSRFRSLTADEQGTSPLLPALLRRLSDAGYPEEAISLFEEVRSRLKGPVRGSSLLAAGEILWDRGDRISACRNFREASDSPVPPPEAVLRVGQCFAIEDKTAGAVALFSSARERERGNLLAGYAEMARGRREEAGSAWKRAVGDTPAGFAARLQALSEGGDAGESARELVRIARGAPVPSPEREAALSALSSLLLRTGDPAGAQDASGEGLREMERWKAAVSEAGDWNFTAPGGRSAWSALTALFPYGEDAAAFRRAGRRFLARISLAEGQLAVLTRLRETSRRLRGAEEAVLRRRDRTAEASRRADEIGGIFRFSAERASAVRGRLQRAADGLVLAEWGASIDPENFSSLEVADRRIRFLRDRLDALSALYSARLRKEWSPPLPPADRLMVFTAQIRLDRTGQRIREIETRMAFLRRGVWNRWKEEFASRASGLLDLAETVPPLAAEGVVRAVEVAARLREEVGLQTEWIGQIRRMQRGLAKREASIVSRRSGLLENAGHALGEAVQELAAAISRRERSLHYLAARAATERLIAGPASPGAGDLSSGDALRREAARHWEAILAIPTEAHVHADEALYALAELQYEEEERRFYADPGPGDQARDHAGSLALFRRVVREHPESPYREPALYGIALCLQETGRSDESIRAMNALLSAYPNSRFADEVHLRLGEEAFDRYEFDEAAAEYRKVGEGASPDLRATARFKLGWSLFLRENPGEAAGAFLESLLLSREARTTGGVPGESLRMMARSLVEADMEAEAEEYLARRGAAGQGPAALLAIQSILDAQNRYSEAAGIADRFARAYPTAPGRIEAETSAAEAVRKGNLLEESYRRKADYFRAFGPGSRWQAAPDRTAADIARANLVSEEGLRTALFFFHGKSRNSPPGDLAFLQAGYDTYLSLYPASDRAGEVAFQRAWLLFETGRKRESSVAFEETADRYGGEREEAARYMAVQSMKDATVPSDAETQAEVIRLSRRYEKAFPREARLPRVLLDHARAHFNLREFREAAEAAADAALRFPEGKDRLTARRLSGDARFEQGNFPEAEREFRAVLAAADDRRTIEEMRKWTGFAMFRRAEGLDGEPSAKLFLRVAEEFPELEIAPSAKFRAGSAFAESGSLREAIAAFRTVESLPENPRLSLDATRRLAVLYEQTGERLQAADRYERLGGAETDNREKPALLLRAAELLAGNDEQRRRQLLLAVASLPGIDPKTRIATLYQAAESSRLEERTEEADRLYGRTLEAQAATPETFPELAGTSAWHRGEYRFARYRAISIEPPLEQTFRAKEAALEQASSAFLDAIRLGDGETVSASLHRLGEGFEEFRNALISSPLPKGLSEEEREEYRFLLEEKAAPIEERAVEAYRKNLLQAVAANLASPWARQSLERLKALRPALFAKRWEYAFPVMTIPVFRGIVERGIP